MKRSGVKKGRWRYRIPKTEAKQELPLPAMALEVLGECLEAGPYYFGKASISPGARVNLKKRLDKRMEIEPWVFHDFRTAFLTQLRELGVPPRIGRSPQGRAMLALGWLLSSTEFQRR